MNVTGGGEAIPVPQTGVEESRLLGPRSPSALGWRARGEHVPTTGTPQERVTQLTQAIASTFETIIRSDLGQWFAFHLLSRAQLPPAAA